METNFEQWSFPATNGEGDIFSRAWLAENPLAIVQIAHGMSEHSGRYDGFARHLCSKGFNCRIRLRGRTYIFAYSVSLY